MTVQKLSQIAPAGSPPALTDQIVGVTGGTTDNLFTLTQIQTTIGAGGVTSVTNTDGTLNASPTTGAVVIAIDPSVYLNFPNPTFSTYLAASGNLTQTGTFNLGFGFGALHNVTSGSRNMAFGEAALNFISSGSRNTAVGTAVLSATTTDTDNTGIGDGVLASCSGGISNTGIGSSALAGVTNGFSNVAIGVSAGRSILGGAGNIIIGGSSGTGINSGSLNTLVGLVTGNSISTGSNNTVIGSQCDTGSNVSGVIVIGTGDGVTHIDYNNTHAGKWNFPQPFVVPNYTVGTLPVGVAGAQAYVTDGDAGLAWGATAVNSGAGATNYLVWYNGTNWTVVGK